MNPPSKWWLFAFFAALQIGDMATTLIGVAHYGAREVNPIFGTTQPDLWQLLLAKAIGLLVVWLVLRFGRRTRWVWVLCGYYVLAVGSNLLMLLI
jgi:hypothetical protein